MQKKLLALAIAGALSAPLAAHAQNVQIYGLLQPSMDFIDNGDDSGTFIAGNNSRLGFKGSEDLGGGLKAIFQIESQLDFDERSGSLARRDSWLGLAGSFGSITIGNHQSAYVRSTASLDPFADTIGDYNNIMSVFGQDVAGGEIDGALFDFNSRFTNSIYYTSPKFGGFQVLASYAMRGERFDDGEDDDSYSVAGTWSSGAFSAMVAYEKQGAFGNGAEPSAWKVGGSFKVLPTTTIYAMVDRIDTDTDADERWGYYVGAKHSMGNIDLLANFMVAKDTDQPGASDDGAKAFALGAVYNFSKRTNIGAYYAQINNDDDGQYFFDSGAYGNTTPGENVKGFSVRMRHSF